MEAVRAFNNEVSLPYQKLIRKSSFIVTVDAGTLPLWSWSCVFIDQKFNIYISCTHDNVTRLIPPSWFIENNEMFACSTCFFSMTFRGQTTFFQNTTNTDRDFYVSICNHRFVINIYNTKFCVNFNYVHTTQCQHGRLNYTCLYFYETASVA